MLYFSYESWLYYYNVFCLISYFFPSTPPCLDVRITNYKGKLQSLPSPQFVNDETKAQGLGKKLE